LPFLLYCLIFPISSLSLESGIMQLVEILCYKSEGRFSSPGKFIRFSIHLIFPAALGPGVDSASNKIQYRSTYWN
jgi:hypothetical protein